VEHRSPRSTFPHRRPSLERQGAVGPGQYAGNPEETFPRLPFCCRQASFEKRRVSPKIGAYISSHVLNLTSYFRHEGLLC
jgi:hypothetical protein